MKKSQIKFILLCNLFCVLSFSQNSNTNKKQAESYYVKAVNNYKNSELYEALDNIEQSIKLNPLNSNSYYIKGVIKQKQNLLNDAILLYKKAIQLNPKNIDALSKCGIAYGTLKDMKNSCKYFYLACENGSNDSCIIFEKFCK